MSSGSIIFPLILSACHIMTKQVPVAVMGRANLCLMVGSGTKSCGGDCGLILVSSEVLDEKKIGSCCFKSTQKEVMGGPGGCVALTSRSA